MKIVEAKRDESNAIIFILEDGSEVSPSAEYIVANKPQIGDEYAEAAVEAPAEAPAEEAKPE